MGEDIKKACVHYVIALAWSDGSMDPVERDFLQGLIERAALSSADRAQLEGWLDTAPPEPHWETLTKREDLAEDVLRQAMILACMDMSVTAKEMAFLHRLREKIGMEEMAFYRIQQEVERVIAAQIKG